LQDQPGLAGSLDLLPNSRLDMNAGALDTEGGPHAGYQEILMDWPFVIDYLDNCSANGHDVFTLEEVPVVVQL
jgi:hypothetical protein